MTYREEAVAVLERGLSVMHNGQVISKLADLPSEADLALGNEEATAKARENLDQSIKNLEAERAKLGEYREVVGETAKANEGLADSVGDLAEKLSENEQLTQAIRRGPGRPRA